MLSDFFCIFAENTRTMKRLTYVILLALSFCLFGCEDPAKSRVYMDEGFRLMMVYSQYEKAEEALDKAIKYDKNNYEAYYHRGCVKFNTYRYQEAIADFEKATELKPDYADAYFNIGRAYYILKDNDKACTYYKLAEKYGRPNLDDYIRDCP